MIMLLVAVAALGGEVITADNFGRLEVVAELGETSAFAASKVAPFAAGLVGRELVVWETDDWHERCRFYVAPRVDPLWVGRHLVTVDRFRGWVTTYEVDACRARSAGLVSEPDDFDDGILLLSRGAIDRRTLGIWEPQSGRTYSWDVLRQRRRRGGDGEGGWRPWVLVDGGGLTDSYVEDRFGVVLYDRRGLVTWSAPVTSSSWAFDFFAISNDRRLVAAVRSSIYATHVHDAPIALWRTDGVATGQPVARASMAFQVVFGADDDLLVGSLTDDIWVAEPGPDTPQPRRWVEAWRTSDGTSLGELPSTSHRVDLLPGGQQLVTWGASTQVWSVPDEVSR